MMDLREIEDLRQKNLNKFWTYILVATATLVGFIYLLISGNSVIYDFIQKYDIIPVVVSMLFVIILYYKAGDIYKNFENEVKFSMMKSILREIVKNDGEVFWVASGKEEENESSEDNLKDKYYSEFDKEYEIYDEKLDVLDKEYIECLRKKLPLLENFENLDEEGKEGLEYYENQMDEITQKENTLKKEYYDNDCNKLKKLEEKCRNSEKPSKKDIYEIEYLKERIEDYEEELLLKNKMDEQYKLKEKETNHTITEEEKKKLDTLTKELEDYNSKMSEKIENIEFDINKISLISILFNAYLTEDDIFWGTYKGIKFTSIEAHDYSTKSHAAVFNGTVLKVKLKNRYENKILLLRKVFFSKDTWYSSIKHGLKKINVKMPTKQEYEVYARNQDISDIVNKDMAAFIDNYGNNNSFLIENDTLYVIMPHDKDKYKFGNLFKRVDDEKQKEKLVSEIRVILDLVEIIGKQGF